MAGGGRGADCAVGVIAVGNALRFGSIGDEEIDARLAGGGTGALAAIADLADIRCAVVVSSGGVECSVETCGTLCAIACGGAGGALGICALNVACGSTETDPIPGPAATAESGAGAGKAEGTDGLAVDLALVD